MNWKHFFHWHKNYSRRRYKKIVYISSLADVPKETKDTIYIIGDKKVFKWVVFQCPDNCGRRVEVNLMKSNYPNWKIEVVNNKVNLMPSVVVKGCGAHFWLVENDVEWAKFRDETY